MNNTAQAKQVKPQGRRQVTSVVLTADAARCVYVQSDRRIDLASIARVFAKAPKSVEVSGARVK